MRLADLSRSSASLTPPWRTAHTAEGLRQALAATRVFYNAKQLTPEVVTPEVIAALDGTGTGAGAATDGAAPLVPLPSLLTRLPREGHVGQQLEKVVLASGLLPSKSAFSVPSALLCVAKAR